jgi:hypothetical protein
MLVVAPAAAKASAVVGVNGGKPRLDQLRRKPRKSIETVLREAHVEPDVPAVDIAQFAQRPQEGREPVPACGRRR